MSLNVEHRPSVFLQNAEFVDKTYMHLSCSPFTRNLDTKPRKNPPSSSQFEIKMSPEPPRRVRSLHHPTEGAYRNPKNAANKHFIFFFPSFSSANQCRLSSTCRNYEEDGQTKSTRIAFKWVARLPMQCLFLVFGCVHRWLHLVTLRHLGKTLLQAGQKVGTEIGENLLIRMQCNS